MIGRRQLPESFRQWNVRWGSHLGHIETPGLTIEERLCDIDLIKRIGPFGFQGNNSTRLVEYPWAYFFSQTASGMDVMEIGGGLSGLQFVLAMEGCRVVNVDPSIDGTRTAKAAREGHATVNRAFSTNVELIQERVEDSNVLARTFDRVFCISVIEHMGTEVALSTMERIERALRPGGLAIMTVDLFLDLHPFGDMQEHDMGANMNIQSLMSASALDLAFGYTDELYGYEQFSPESVRQRTPEFFVGDFRLPVVAQMFVARKRAARTQRDV